ncbi:flavodoxin domain-containing protein [Haloarchaeobius sp. HME9146]|uniref:flavodoxin domain-containing protein n=1 Tax=Haloarchaeobius sp. HME9146 TaxID=2978732 RepID=UPI0021BE7479|nr:flavodoxin domain-containing protein [Haloarchaeobius sp. HME9146]MCT9097521.1 protoporphyrinogen oxidase [Haloarchaeobius sp. HME9146]
MADFLVCYGTGEGQTAKVAAAIEADLAARGHEVTTVDLTELPPTLDVTAFDAVLVGASIHMGTHQKHVAAFVRENRRELASRPSGFFQVCLSSAVEDEARQLEAARYVEEFVEKTSWHPDRVASFAGAIRYSEYGLLKRVMMKKIASEATGDTDTSRDYEYTDWDAVDEFAVGFAEFVEGESAAGEPDAATAR